MRSVFIAPRFRGAWLLCCGYCLFSFLLGACSSKGALGYEIKDAGTTDQELMAYQPSPINETEGEAVVTQATRIGNIHTTLDSPVVLLHSELPDYPRSLQRAGIQGLVEVQFVVDEEGKVTSATVTKSPDQRLSDLSLSAIRTWRFAPMTINGCPTKARFSQRFPFRLVRLEP